MNPAVKRPAGAETIHISHAAPMRQRLRGSCGASLTAALGLAAAVGGLGFVGVAGIVGIPATAQADVLKKLPEKADDIEKKYAPAYDYDVDACYVTAAIGEDGKVNPGLKLGGAVNGHCRDEPQLVNANTYARAKCNNGWCAIMYANYHEKDQATDGVGEIERDGNGHRHDWEHVIVWVSEDKVKFVSHSAHSSWVTDDRSKVRFVDGEHPKLVFHKEGSSTHFYRLANDNDKGIMNGYHRWFYPTVVGWNGYPNDFRNRLLSYDFGSATNKLSDKYFKDALNTAMPKGIPFNPFGAH